LFSRQQIALFCGILMFAMAVGGTVAGELPERFGGVSSRSRNPGQYWSALAGYYLASFDFIGYYFYKVHGRSGCPSFPRLPVLLLSQWNREMLLLVAQM
jgi:hypothetical protein